jgi:catechol 2,3-dioxygenase-like lactoylglutathione lyase family enzyme
MISGLNHITFSVSDLENSFHFYKDILGFRPLVRHSKGAYFLAGDLWFCLDLDSTTRNGPLPEYTHVAFSIDQKAFEEISTSIRSSQVKIWKENKSEGQSIYFLDPDGHKLEVHVGDWKSRLQALKTKPWNDSVEIFELPGAKG